MTIMTSLIPARTANKVGKTTSRREFLKASAAASGAFVLATFVPFRNRAQAAEGGGMAQGVIDPNVFLKIGADDSITLISKHFEMGQGITTGMATLVADELDADWSKMRFEFAPNNPALYNNLVFGPYMVTGGSTSMFGAWMQMRQVGAAARAMFLSAAAAAWNVPASELKIDKGVISHPASGRKTSYGKLSAEAMKVSVPALPSLKLKDPKDWKLIGKRAPRLDSIVKTTGAATFALDIRRPGMLTAMVKRPPQFGATVVSFDATEATKVDGVVEVVQIPQGVAVLAKDTWSAMRGRDALKVTWDTSKAELRSTDDVLDDYRKMLAKPGPVALKRGDAVAGLSGAANSIDAEFTFPYLAHAPMEPLNCIMELSADKAEIWSGCQLHSIDTYLVSKALGMKPEQIRIHTQYGGGSFGRRGNPVADWTLELAAIAKAINGRAPVHVVWTREDDIKGGFYRPLALHRVKAALDAKGKLTGWQHQVVNKSIFTGTPFQDALVKDGVDHSSVEGIVDTSYAIDNLAVESYMAQTPVPVLWWRSVGHSHTAHVMETVVDELAVMAKQDPVAFRLGLLAKQPRDAAVLKLAAQKAGWGKPLPKGRGRGVAYHLSFGTRIAMIADVTLTGKTYKVDRVVAAVDCGVAVNPDVVTAQIEGAIGFALSTVMRNQVTLKNGVVQQNNYDDYEPTRMREMPKVEVHIVQSLEPPSGIGEPGVAPLAPAIGNALFVATGKRLRSLPLVI
jgi:isoquinoline 1-oxidoreductase beta subunit